MRRLIWLGIFGLTVWATRQALRMLDRPSPNRVPVPMQERSPGSGAVEPASLPRMERTALVDVPSVAQQEDLLPTIANDLALVAYCARCRERRSLTDVHEETTATGRRAARGACSVCGTTVFTFLPVKQPAAS